MTSTLVLHMGRPKTGSTSLQNFLHRYHDALLRRGVLYPRTGRFDGQSIAHTNFFLSMIEPHRREPYLPPPAMLAADYAERLHAEVRALAPRYVVLSDEGLFLPKHDMTTLIEIKRLLNFPEYIIFIVLRQQRNLLESEYAQSIMGPRQMTLKPKAFIEYVEEIKLFDYETKLLELESVFGHSALRVCWLEDIVGDIVQTFLPLIDINVKEIRYTEYRDNQRLSWLVIGFLRYWNKTRIRRAKLTRLLLLTHERGRRWGLTRRLDRMAVPFSEAEKEAFGAKYEAMNQRIRERYPADWWRGLHAQES